MLVFGIFVVLFGAAGLLAVRRNRAAAGVVPILLVPALLLLCGGAANAAIVPTVPLGTSANYSVLGASTVTNTGSSTLDASLGLWPGTSITGFPPGLVVRPGTTDITDAAAKQAQSDLTAAFVNAQGRPVDTTTTADLANLDLGAGVYAGPSHGALGLTGPLTLNGAGDPSSVFVFQTDSTLITGSSSTVTLINGAQECNVFWEVGSSATLGTGSVFVGNILALTSITVTTGVTVHGRALARNGAVTLDDDTFTQPKCSSGSTTTTTTTTTGGGTSSTGGSGGTSSTGAGGSTSSTGAGGSTSSTGGSTAKTIANTATVSTVAPGLGGTQIPGVASPPLAFTGADTEMTATAGIALLGFGGFLLVLARRRARALDPDVVGGTS